MSLLTKETTYLYCPSIQFTDEHNDTPAQSINQYTLRLRSLSQSAKKFSLWY